MTATREEIVRPVVAKVRSQGLVEPRVASEEALEVLRRKPIKTVWGQAYGLPIYDRLPGISQAYKIEAGPDSAYVYISPNFPKKEGPGSLQPGRARDDFAVFIMEDGEITWQHGQREVPRLEVDTAALNNGAGLDDGQYKAGYLMSYEVPPVPELSLARVEDSVLSEAYVAYAAGSDVIHHEDFEALTEVEVEAWWPDDQAKAGAYIDGAWYVLDFGEPVWPERISFVGQPGEKSTAEMAVYWSDDAIIWRKGGQVAPSDGSWTFQNTSTVGEEHRYWRFFWWDGNVTVGKILYTGEALFEDARVNGPVTTATPFIDDLYEEIDQVHLLVATFTVQNGAIVQIQDKRRFMQRRYEPVAKWLTSFEDLSLRCYFEDIEQYAALYMAPPTADYHFYQELDTNACSGEGYISVGVTPEPPLVDFPDVVELTYTQEYNPPTPFAPGSDLYVGQTEDLLGTDPPPDDVSTDGFTYVRGPGFITPIEIEGLAPPTLDPDAANKRWTDDLLNAGFTIDDGIY